MPRNVNDRVFVAGHRGMVGSAIVRRLQSLWYADIVTAGREELNLLDQKAVETFFQQKKIAEWGVEDIVNEALEYVAANAK